MRKRSDEDMDKYNQLVVADEQEPEREYQNDYRGRVQNRKVEMEMLPLYALDFERHSDGVRANIVFDHDVDAMNQRLAGRTLYVVAEHRALDDKKSKRYFLLIDSLTTAINRSHDTEKAVDDLFVRAMAYSEIQDYQQAIDDLSTYLQIWQTQEKTGTEPAPTEVLALWQRAACQARISQFQASEGANTELSTASVLADLNHALTLRPHNPYLLYNRACINAQRKNYRQAIDDYTEALTIEPNMAEAYFNRGICYLENGQQAEGETDLSKAGELGLYSAYSVLKSFGASKGGK